MKYQMAWLVLGSASVWACVNPMQVDGEGSETGGSSSVDSAGSGGKRAGGGALSSSLGGQPASSGGTRGDKPEMTESGGVTAGGGAAAAGGGAAADSGGAAGGGGANGASGGAGYCPLGDGIEYDPTAAYPYCQASAGELCGTSTVQGVEGHGPLLWEVGSGEACLCWELCEAATDCASAETGTATPTCARLSRFQEEPSREEPGYCALSCENGESCPDGMRCEDRAFGKGAGGDGAICVWVSAGEGCDLSSWQEEVAPRVTTVPGEPSTCPFGAELEYDPAAAYPFCQLATDDPLAHPWENRCRHPALAGWSAQDAQGNDVDLCLCVDECDTAADCIAGDTGNAVPECLHEMLEAPTLDVVAREPVGLYVLSSGMCGLTCDHGEACPDGMVCALEGKSLNRHVCTWASRGAGCDTSDWPDVMPAGGPLP